MLWLKAASKLPGKALLTGLLLWHLAGKRKAKTVSLGNILAAEYGIGRNAKARCLKALQRAGLVSIEQRPGCNPTVTILDAVEPANL